MSSNVYTQPSSVSMKPKGLSVTFDPHLSYQSVPKGNQNPPCWSFHGAATNGSQNISISHVLPNKSVAGSHSQFTNVGAIENQSGFFPQKSRNNPLPPLCTRLGVPYPSIDPRYDTQSLFNSCAWGT